MDKSYVENGISLELLKDRTVFMSYGHDAYSPYAERLVEDLKKYVKHVWFDAQQIRDSYEWDYEIEDGISNSAVVVALMTEHAYRRPNGVCLNEVVFASNACKEIIPMMVQDISVPLILCRVQYIDVRKIYDPENDSFDEEQYQESFRKLLICLENPARYSENSFASFKKYLQPMDNQHIISQKTGNFVGREWLIGRVRDWIKNDNDSPVFILLAAPGTGKSAFVAKISMALDEVNGVHFCDFQNKNSLRVSTIINTLSYYLAYVIEDYKDKLSIDLSEISNLSDYDRFRKLILDPLSELEGVCEDVVLAVDGIDEMEESQLKVFLTLLDESYSLFPKWFKLIVTARSNSRVKDRLVNIKPYIIDANCDDNINDIKDYIVSRAADKITLTEEEIANITERSEGCFHYIEKMMTEIISNGGLSGITLPSGIRGSYVRDFDRLFTDKDYRKVKPLLEVMCAAREPLSVKKIKSMLRRERDALEGMDILEDYMVRDSDSVFFFHKSIADWLLDESPTYNIDIEDGEQRFADWIVDNADDWQDEPYIHSYGFDHLYRAEYYNEFCDVLNDQSDLCVHSFSEFMNRAIIEDYPCDKLFRKLMKNVDDLELYICRIMHDSYEKRSYTDYIERIAFEFASKYDWLPDYAEMLQKISRGEMLEARDIGERILELQTNDDVCAIILNDIGECYRVRGDMECAMSTYEKAFSKYKKNEYAKKCFWSWYNYHDLMAVTGRIDEADEAMSWMLSNVNESSIEAFKLWRIRGNIKLYRNEREESAQYYKNCLKVATDIYSKRLMGEANYVVAEALATIDNASAWEYLNEAIKIEKQLKYKPGMARTYMARTELLVAEGRWDEAIETGLDGMKCLEEANYMYGVARTGRSVAKAYYAKGEYENAYRHAYDAHSFLKSKGAYPIERRQAWDELKEYAVKIGKIEEAEGLDSFDE